MAMITSGATQNVDITSIVADRIQFNTRTEQLSGEGNVRFISDDWKIVGESFLYENNRIHIEGPIHATLGDTTVLLADQADIDPDAMTRILRGVQLLVDQQRQLVASTAIEDSEGNVIIRDAIVTGCRICKPGEEPLWHFRTSALIVPAGSRRAYLKDPVMTVGSLAFGGISWLSIPADDGRYRGFLFPSLSYSNGNGASVQTPYFLTFGEHANLTLSPGISSKGRAGLEYAYAHRFTVGRLDLEGAVNRKESDETFIKEYIDFTSDWRFSDELTATASHSSDNNDDHEHVTGVYTGVQDLSVATLTHRTNQTLLFTDLVHANPPHTHGTNRMTSHIGIGFRHQIQTGGFDLGFKGWGSETRIEDADLRAPNPRDTAEESVDPSVPELVVRRYGLTGELSRQARFASGLVARLSLLGRVDRLAWEKGLPDSMSPGMPHNNPEAAARTTLNDRVAAIDLGLPLVRHAERQVQALEPFAQLVYARDRTGSLPELPESRIMLDPGNIRSLDRFANDSLKERGLRANVGVKLTGFLDSDASYEVSFGTIYRREYDRDAIAEELGETGNPSNNGKSSINIQNHDPDFVGRADHVVSATYRTGDGLRLNQAVHVGKEKRVRSAQSIVEYVDDRQTVSTLASWSRPTIAHEGFWGYTVSAARKLTDRATLGLSHSVGSEQDSAVKSGVNLVYRHQCAQFIAELERTAYRASHRKINLEASLSFRLGGFRTVSANGQEVCR